MNSNITFLILLQQLTDIDFLFKASTGAIYLVNFNSKAMLLGIDTENLLLLKLK